MRLPDPNKIRFLRSAMNFSGAVTMPAEVFFGRSLLAGFPSEQSEGIVKFSRGSEFHRFPSVLWQTTNSLAAHENWLAKRHPNYKIPRTV